MEFSTALNLIIKGVEQTEDQHWADLGAGGGLFTRALAQLLPSGSITAIDQNLEALNIPEWHSTPVKLITQTANFETFNFSSQYHGFLMANSLHFVADAAQLLGKLKQALLPGGRIIIVEYESETPNRWVPYPVSFNKLKDVAARAGFTSVKKLHRTHSQYQAGGIYSGLLLF
ncbi:MAG: methyltransferase domain-containing protein [Cyclobacteriaceae bacterium]|nr:methyltransferase domain-containing protein [Cyclobacteriaceae bacterium]